MTQLRYFVAAASTGSMTAAAIDLRIAQSAVSTAVGGLERSLGVQLFIRQHARGLSLTGAGHRLHVAAQELLGLAAGLEETARGLAVAATGDIAFGCFVTLAPFVMPQILRWCAERHPRLNLNARELDTPEITAELQEGRIEIALMYDLALGTGIERHRIGSVPPYVIVAPDHRLAKAPGIHLSELQDESMVMLDIPHSAEYFAGLMRAAGVQPKVQHRSTSYETVRSLVAQGLGYAVLNQRPTFATTYSGESVVSLPLFDNVADLPIVLARIAHTRPTGRAQAVAQACAAVLPGGDGTISIG
ncbi:LysR family transcriptional regulator [Sciscionella marina]|uniref:LysR family transcriptional regulator n=1 Tax=Sciscionella marina TaxID=508770 RepID=UPI001F09B336|nr:LysR family transcriptional regulator [Sciscionella marina]